MTATRSGPPKRNSSRPPIRSSPTTSFFVHHCAQPLSGSDGLEDLADRRIHSRPWFLISGIGPTSLLANVQPIVAHASGKGNQKLRVVDSRRWQRVDIGLIRFSAGEDDDAGVGATADRVREGRPGTFDLAGSALVTQLSDELDHLAQGPKCRGANLGEKAAARVDGQAPAELDRTRVEQGRRAAGLAQSELLAGEELAGGVGVLALHDVEVTGADTGLLVGGGGGQGGGGGHGVVGETRQGGSTR